MRIANNIMAMNTHRQYTINNNAVSKSAEKLSSGYRINRAGDDAAGLAISEKMRSQIRGLNMASKNSQDGNSLIQTAEGALQEVHSMLQRMNELAVQSASGTNQTIDREALDLEFQQLVEEIDQISQQTTFNDMELLTGQLAGASVKGAAGAADINKLVAGEVFATKGTITKVHTGLTGTKAGAYTVELGQVGADGTFTKNATTDVAANDKIRVTFTDTDGNAQITLLDYGDVFKDADGNALVAGDDVAKNTVFTMDLSDIGLGKYEVATADETITKTHLMTALSALSGEAVELNAGAAAGNSLKIQVGAKTGETMEISINAVNSTTLSVNGLNIDQQNAAAAAIDVVREAVNIVSTQRATLGAAQNRLEHKIANLDTSAENLSAAESRIRDVDLASEMTSFTKNNILSQAATAMLAQANTIPQNVLQLLR